SRVRESGLPQPGPGRASGPIAFRRLGDGATFVRLDGAERLRVGLHLGPQAIDQRSQALPVDREAPEECPPAPGLLGGEAARLAPPGRELDGAGALHRQGPAMLAGLEGVQQAGGGPRRRPERATLIAEEDTGSALGPESPAYGGGPEIAAVARPAHPVSEFLLRLERLVLDEALPPPAGGGP